jgi:hypothetical protein
MPQNVPARASPFHSVALLNFLSLDDAIFDTKAAAAAGPQMAVFDATTISSTLSGNNFSRGNNFIMARDPVPITTKCTSRGTVEKITLDALDQPLSKVRQRKLIDMPITDMRMK